MAPHQLASTSSSASADHPLNHHHLPPSQDIAASATCAHWDDRNKAPTLPYWLMKVGLATQLRTRLGQIERDPHPFLPHPWSERKLTKSTMALTMTVNPVRTMYPYTNTLNWANASSKLLKARHCYRLWAGCGSCNPDWLTNCVTH